MLCVDPAQKSDLGAIFFVEDLRFKARHFLEGLKNIDAAFDEIGNQLSHGAARVLMIQCAVAMRQIDQFLGIVTDVFPPQGCSRR